MQAAPSQCATSQLGMLFGGRFSHPCGRSSRTISATACGRNGAGTSHHLTYRRTSYVRITQHPRTPAHRARNFPQVRSHRIAVRRGRGLVHRFTLGSVQRIRRVVIPSGRSIRLCRSDCMQVPSVHCRGRRASAFAEMFAVAVLACEHRTASGSTCVR